MYALPLVFATGERAIRLRRDAPQAIVAEVEAVERRTAVTGLLVDAVEEADFARALLEIIARRRQLKGTGGEVVATTTRAFRALRGGVEAPLPSSVLRVEQSNTSLLYGDRLILKLFRRVTEGLNPDLEIGRFLTERTAFAHVPRVAGALEYRAPKREPITLGILQEFVPNEGDSWQYTLDQVKVYYERALAKGFLPSEVPVPQRPLLDLVAEDPPPLVREMVGAYLETARLLGQRTGELHRALCSVSDDPDFAPEPFTALYQRALYQSMRNLTTRTFDLLREHLGDLPPEVASQARRVLERENRILEIFRGLIGRKMTAARTRCHGDYHLGQVLYTGRDFVIIDFEGEPARPLTERRLKRSPLRDVASMLRSFGYATCTVLHGSSIRPEDVPVLEPWARFWELWVSSAFLRAYLRETRDSPVIPRSRAELELLLHVLLLEKAIYELGYEVNHRPTWVRVPLQGILWLVG